MSKKRRRRVGDYPSHLPGLATNRNGGNQLQREQGPKGDTYSSEPTHLDPTIIARAAPPWLQGREFNRENLAGNVRRLFDNLAIRKVSDLAGFEFAELLAKHSISLVNWTKIAQGLGQLLSDDESHVSLESIVVGDPSKLELIEHLLRTIDRLSANEKIIISFRKAPNGVFLSFKKISELLNWHVGNVWNAERNAQRKIKDHAYWYRILCDKLETLERRSNDGRISIRDLEEKDKCFVGSSKELHLLRYFVRLASSENADIGVFGGEAHLIFQNWRFDN